MGSSKGFWFKFNPSDFIGGTDMLTHEQVGAYIRLLCYQFTDKGLLTIKRIKFVLGAQFAEIWPEIKHKFTEVDGGWVNDRLSSEMNLAFEKAEKNRENGQKGGRPRKTERLSNEKPNGYEKNNRSNSNSISNYDNSMDEIVEESKVIPMKDDTTLSLSPKPKSDDPNLIEREYKTLFVQHFDQKGHLNPTRAAYVDVVLKLEAEGMSRAEACALINEQGRRWRLCADLEGKSRKHFLNCENWLEMGEWQKDYEAMAASIQKNKAAASASPVQAQLDRLSGGKKL